MGQGLAGIPGLARIERLLLDAGAAWAGPVLGAFLYGWISSRAGALPFQPEQLSPETYRIVVILSILAWVAASLAAENGDGRWRSARDDLGSVVASAVLAGLFLVLGMVGLKLYEVSRGWLLSSTVLTALFASLWRVALRYARKAWYERGHGLSYVLVVGDGPTAESFISTLRTHPESGLRLRAWLHLDGRSHDHTGSRDAPTAGPPSAEVAGASIVAHATQSHADVDPTVLLQEALEEALHASVVDEVVCAIPLDRRDLLITVADVCRVEGKPLHLLFGSLVEELGSVKPLPWYNELLLSRVTPPLKEIQYSIKRVLDIVGALVGLLLLSPVFLAVAVAIKLDSPGPVFYAGLRVGRNGRLFRCYKLRSMIDGADKLKPALESMNEARGPVFKLRNDPRVTRVGRFLRRTSIDELPQLWNVLRGEMSLVGPRPPLPEEVRKYEPAWRKRLSVRPGITGPWQVNGRSDTDFDRWMELDRQYLERWSLWTDLKILVKTVLVVVRGEGAY